MALQHMILWYDATMSAKPVQISIDLELLRRIDSDPETREKGRSAFVRSAVSSYLDAKRRRDVDTAIRAAYGGAEDEMQAEVADLMDAQAWPARLNRADIWLLDRARPDKRRPVLVLSRASLIAALHTVTVAAITSTRRGSPTEVELGVEERAEGPVLRRTCASVFTVASADLRQCLVGTVQSRTRMRAVCRALAIATACD